MFYCYKFVLFAECKRCEVCMKVPLVAYKKLINVLEVKSMNRHFTFDVCDTSVQLMKS